MKSCLSIFMTGLKTIHYVGIGIPFCPSTSTTYWTPSTSWRLCERLFYSYHILNTINKLRLCQRLFYSYHILNTIITLEIMSEVVLLLPYTEHHQQVGDYIRGCSTSTTYWPPLTSWRLCQILHMSIVRG